MGYLNPNLYTFEQGYVFRDIHDGLSNANGGAPGEGPQRDAARTTASGDVV